MADASTPLTTEQLAELDAEYSPFPSFKDWPQSVPRADLWDQSLGDLAEATIDTDEGALRRAQEVAIRAAAFDTGAIEGLYPTDRGLTLTVATQAAAWEQTVKERAPDALEFFEAQMKALELVLDVVTRGLPSVTEAWLRRLHEELTSPQETYSVQTPVGMQEQPLPRGKYKQYPNHVKLAHDGTHAYAPVDQTGPEMERLVSELNNDDFATAHPVLQASYAHYGLVAIHPFADGNGRVARALASVYIYRPASVPLLILADQRTEYFAALADADEGQFKRFVQFVRDAARSGLSLVSETLRAAKAPQPEDALQQFRTLYTAQADLTHAQLDQIAENTREEFMELLLERIRGLDIPEGVAVEVTPGSGAVSSDPPPGFRPLVAPGPIYVNLGLRSAAPAKAGRQVSIDFLVSTKSDIAETVRIQLNPDFGLTFGLQDVQPGLSMTAQQRTRAFIDRLLGSELDALFTTAEDKLRGSGYI